MVEEEEEEPRRDVDDAGLVLIKSFKTGSTTMATYIAQVAYFFARTDQYFDHHECFCGLFLTTCRELVPIFVHSLVLEIALHNIVRSMKYGLAAVPFF